MGIEAVAMDMWEPFIASTVAHVPAGRSKIVFDRFHAMKHMAKAVDAVRKAGEAALVASGPRGTGHERDALPRSDGSRAGRL